MKTKIGSNLFVIGVVIAIFSACADEEVTYRLNTKQVQLYCNRTFALEVTPALQGLEYTSLNSNIATVSADGLVKAKLVGTTKIVVKDAQNRFIDTVKVVVNTLYTAYSDPYLGFGATKSAIIKALNVSDFEFYQSSSYNILEVDNSNEADQVDYIYWDTSVRLNDLSIF